MQLAACQPFTGQVHTMGVYCINTHTGAQTVVLCDHRRGSEETEEEEEKEDENDDKEEETFH